MQYEKIQYRPDSEDPSITLETQNLVAKVIDNTGLTQKRDENIKSYFGRYGVNSPLPISHHLGSHGIRCLYDKEERRNLVIALGSWMNLQGVQLEGIENDPVDERSWAGVARGWPLRLEQRGAGVAVVLDALPNTQFDYRVEFQPAEPDAIDFSMQFVFHRKPESGPARLRCAWPCYMNAYDDVRFFYPKGEDPAHWEWGSLGEIPDMIVGDPVGYVHQQTPYYVSQQAMPVGYGLIGERALALMFDDPTVKFFVVNAGGHISISPVQNPAWDFEWTIEDYPLDTPVGFSGRLIYTKFEGPEQIMERYNEWRP